MVTGHSEGLAWWNFAFLFTMTLIPFTGGPLGLYAESPLAVDIFAGNILVGSLVSWPRPDLSRTRTAPHTCGS